MYQPNPSTTHHRPTPRCIVRFGAALVLSGLAMTAPSSARAQSVPNWQKGGEIDIQSFESDLQRLSTVTPHRDQLPNTYQPGFYVAGTQHVQGLAWGQTSRGPVWAVTHNRTQWPSAQGTCGGARMPGRSLLVLCDGQRCYHHVVGTDAHGGGGVQIVGSVLLTSDESRNPVLYDIRNIAAPVKMACTFQPQCAGGAAGIVWHAGLKRHVATLDSGGGDKLFVSNKLPLDDPNCVFTQVYTSQSGLVPPGEGLSQLFYDAKTKDVLSVGGTRDGQGRQIVRTQRFSLISTNGGTPYASLGRTTETAVVGPAGGHGPSLRWGGTIRSLGNTFDLVLAPRALSVFGALNPNMKIDIYTAPPQPNTSAFEEVQERAIAGHNDRIIYNISKTACASECLATASCRSADYVVGPRRCQLSSETRDTVPTAYGYYAGHVYLHRRLGALANFEEVSGWAISGHNAAILYGQSKEQCADACWADPQCRSADYVVASRRCQLSRQSRETVGSAYRQYADHVYLHRR